MSDRRPWLAHTVLAVVVFPVVFPAALTAGAVRAVWRKARHRGAPRPLPPHPDEPRQVRLPDPMQREFRRIAGRNLDLTIRGAQIDTEGRRQP